MEINMPKHLCTGNRITAALYFTNITIEDDTSKGRHACIGYSTKGGKGERHGFTIHVTAGESLEVSTIWLDYQVEGRRRQMCKSTLILSRKRFTTPYGTRGRDAPKLHVKRKHFSLLMKLLYFQKCLFWNLPILKVFFDIGELIIAFSANLARKGWIYWCRSHPGADQQQNHRLVFQDGIFERLETLDR